MSLGKIPLPNEWMGEKIEGSMERVLSRKPEKPVEASGQGIVVEASINPREYIKVPGHDIVIAREVAYKNQDWNQTLDALANDGLIMPRIDHFMAHFMNVRQGANNHNHVLFYADGTPMKYDEVDELWAYLSSTDRQNRGVCWSWLDAKFKDKDEKLVLETNHRAGRHDSFPLEKYFSGNGLVGLDFNSQGLPKSAYGSNDYVQGENMYFWKPVAERVARFIAGSDWTNLVCNGDPAYSDASLGVFPCAEGAAANSGGNK